jgi:glycosyltransferase involved in cell wall biosynthesis
MNAVTGILTPEGDLRAYADAIARLLDDDRSRQAMAKAAHRFVHEERSLIAASKRLETILRKHLGDPYYER